MDSRTPLRRTRPRDRSGAARRYGLPAALALGTALGLAGCDFPLEVPRWETEWELPVVAGTFEANDLMPEGVTATGEGFLVEPLVADRSVRIGEVCELCTCFDGPIPELRLTPRDWEVPLPALLIGAGLVEGRAEVTLHNEMGFDLLDDGEGGTGFLEVALTNRLDDRVLQSLLFDDPFPPGDSLTLQFDLSGLELNRLLVARVSGETPGSGCDSVSIDEDDGIRAAVAVESLRAEWVDVIVVDEVLQFDSRTVDLGGPLSSRLENPAARIALDIEVVNDSPVDAELLLSIAADPAEHFGEGALLVTPMPVPAATPAGSESPPGSVDLDTRPPLEPGRSSARFLLDLDRLNGRETLYFRTANRVAGDRIQRFFGPESVRYTVRLRAIVPSEGR